MSEMNDAIAIVGIGLRFPCATNPDQFWDNLVSGRDCARELSRDEVLAMGVAKEKVEAGDYVFRSYEVEDLELFDARFFGLSPREARMADPQLRILLEVAQQCIEDAAHDLAGTNTGLYLGVADHKYWLYHNLFDSPLEEENEIAKRIFAFKDFFATQISHKLNLTGPSISLNTACSSALLATHEACNHLLMYDCDYALAGGCEILKGVGYRYQEGGLSARDGFIRAFDKDASGTVFGSGAGLVLLRRLPDALDDNDHIYAVIRSTAVNNDGNAKVGYMAPGVRGQMGVIDEALNRAGVNPRKVSYVEAHGTGTKVGDPIEIEALSNVYRKYTDSKQFCAIGSVKTNVGHLSIAAGVAGLIKTALMMKHKKIPPSLHYSEPNPEINFPESPFFVNVDLADWESEEGSRIAGVSAFGVGGTNVHAIVEEAPPVPSRHTDHPHNKLILLSAKSTESLGAYKQRLGDYLAREPRPALADVAYTLAAGRAHHTVRDYILADDIASLVDRLREREPGSTTPGKCKDTPSIVFMFPGQGAQYVNMGRELFEQEPIFYEAVQECRARIRKEAKFDLLDILYPRDGKEEEARQRIAQTEYTQPCLFVVSYALGRLFTAWGAQPQGMIGHSIGEYVAACLGGVMTLDDALRLVCMRGKLMQSMPSGSMLSVQLPQDAILPYIGSEVSVAGVNSPLSTVLSGSSEAIAKVRKRLDDDGIRCSTLHTSHAFHSPMMEPALEPFEQYAAGVELSAPRVPFISNVSGEWISDVQATDPAYWARQLRNAVEFSKGIESIAAFENVLLLEVGPGSTLTSLTRQRDDIDSERVIRTMRRPQEDGSDVEFALRAFGDLWKQGLQADWAGFFRDKGGSRISLPTYEFERKPFWLDPGDLERRSDLVREDIPLEHPLLGRRVVSSPRAIVYENVFDKETPGFIADHRLVETVIFPGAGYTQLALAAGRFFVKNKKLRVDDIRFAQAMMLPDGVRKIVQTIATACDNGCTFEIVSRTEGASDPMDKGAWVLHAKGRISAHSEAPKPYPLPQLARKDECELIPLSKYYDALKFITFGPSFRAIRQLWIGTTEDGEMESVGLVALPEHLVSQVEQYSFHPVLLDAAFQVIDGPKISESGTLPVGLGNFTVFDTVPKEFYVHAVRRNDNREEFSIGRITALSKEGMEIARIEHYLQKEITDVTLARDQLMNVLFETKWIASEKQEAAANERQRSGWALLGEESAVLAGLQKLLEHQGEEVLALYGAVPGEASSTQPAWASDLRTRLAGRGLAGIVFAPPLAPAQSTASICVELVEIVKLLSDVAPDSPPSLCILTRGANAISESDPGEEEAAVQGAAWGVGNSIAAEHPELRCLRVDTDDTPESLQALAADLLRPDRENQVAFRNGRRFVPRLSHYSFEADNSQRLRMPKGPFDIRLTRFGTFDSFVAKEIVPDFLGENDVLVEMHTAALNFKETLYVLGFLNPNERDAVDFDFGMEGAGRIKKAGTNVKHVKAGDDVIVWHNGCLTSDFVVGAERVTRMPSVMNYREAACVPTVFMTAYYALFNLAGIGKGDRVLIHAAAGGVGQVAVQIARNVGAEVFATASRGKWDHLRSQGVTRIFDSRTLSFSGDIMQSTGGKGVDIVLNSLAGEFIEKSFDCLAPNGRFVEIGKKEIWSTNRARAYRPDVHYHFFEIGEDVVSGGIGGASIIGELMQRVLDDFVHGKLTPLPMSIYDASDIAAAFRFLSAGKNIGKVVIDLRSHHSKDGMGSLVSPEKQYLITGGLGALGFLTARWLSEKGAKHLVLTSRRQPEGETAAKISDLRKAGIHIEVMTGDVAELDDVVRIFSRIDESGKPLGGVLHCAGVLEDGVLVQLTRERFEKCLRPKVSGAMNLHRMTVERELDFFVCFSSVSAIMDGGGQGNYAAANAFMDRLMRVRRHLGLAGLSVNWGAWANVGMAAELAARTGADTSRFLSGEEAFLALETLLMDGKTQGAVCKLGPRLATSPASPFFTDLIAAAHDESDGRTELERLIAENPEASLESNMEQFIRAQVIRVLGASADEEINFDEEFVNLGVDSLSMTELKNAIQHGLGENIKMATLFAHSSVARLARHLAAQRADVSEVGPAPANAAAKAGLPAPHARRCMEFVRLSETESQENLFCFPGLNSNVFDFFEFSELNRAKYRVQVGEINNDLDNLETDIPAIAEDAIRQMESIQPAGPYALLGYSYGGVIALEAASQLAKSDKQVRFLLMVDTFPHFELRSDHRFMTYMSALIADSLLAPMSLEAEAYEQYCRKIMEAPADELAAFFEAIGKRQNGSANVNMNLLNSIIRAGKARTRADYTPPSRIDGIDIHFIRAGQHPDSVRIAKLDGFLDSGKMTDDVYGWASFVRNRFRVRKIDGHHNTLLKSSCATELSSHVDDLFRSGSARG